MIYDILAVLTLGILGWALIVIVRLTIRTIKFDIENERWLRENKEDDE